MNVIMITNCARMDLVHQTLTSLEANARDWGNHTITLVIDKGDGEEVVEPLLPRSTVIWNAVPAGASASRNIGAASIPKYRRQSHVMFIDDDVYMLPDWDETLSRAFAAAPVDEQVMRGIALSGHAHPFNKAIGKYEFDGVKFSAALVLSTVHIAMPWWMFDVVGYFVEPGGPGGSEDVEWCARATIKGCGLAVTNPMCVIHCGMMSSSGNPIVGYDLMAELNQKLIEDHNLVGQVRFG